MRESGQSMRLPAGAGLFHLLQRVRDEAHRSAVSYHLQLRIKRNLKSLLDEIESIGEVMKKSLLKVFPNIEAIAGASMDRLRA